ncbi:MAG TPA: citramalate synthase [Chthoniobacterales bacterium]|jgi:2-isopropylmalate synthase|nr:citramalate synthase [Chthoniobacterales bacterium]
MNPTPITIYDTTLRDGTQAEGISFSVHDKIRIAEKLDVFGIRYIEGGWPGSNPKDIAFFDEAKHRKWETAKICAFGSTCRAQIAPSEDPQIALLLSAETPAVTIVGKSWRLHAEKILGVSIDENRRMIRDSIAYLKARGREVIFDAEHFFDGYKDDPEHSMATLEAAVDGGADVLVLCDTNGGTMVHEVAEITAAVVRACSAPVGIHTHNDCELGVANALAAIRAGATQVQGTINGYGERTGNCNLTSLIPNLQLKFHYNVVPDLSRLRELSLFVDELANCQHNIRAPYVGTTAFTHKGGLHAHAVQKLARSYEHIVPETVGNHQTIVVSELSGQSNVLAKARELGFKLEKGSPEVAAILKEVKRLEHVGYEFEAAEASFELLIRRILGPVEPFWELLEYHCTYIRSVRNDYETCEATVKLRVNREDVYTVAEGDGPVNALDAALRKALVPVYPSIGAVTLSDYKVRIIGSNQGTGARTRVLIDSTDRHDDWCTVGVSDNIIEASWLALVDSYEYKLRRS